MKSQKNIIVLSLLVLGLVLGACSKKGNKTPILNGARNARTSADDDKRLNLDTPSSQTTWGDVISQGSDDYEFDREFKRLMGATLPEEYIGDISGQEGADTGVRFWGEIKIQNGRFNESGSNNLSLAKDSRLRIVIWDSFTGETDEEGNEIPEYPLYFKSLESGRIDGNYAEMKFSDSYGSITLSGNFDSAMFEGTMTYRNTRQHDGSSGASGTLGYFRVETCGFFDCD